MDWNIGDIAVVNQEYDQMAHNSLFYLTAFSDGTAIGYLRTSDHQEIKYSCPLTKITRIARVVKWGDSHA